MKVIRIFITFALLCAFCFSSLWSQIPEVPDPVLKVGDVEHFIKTFPLLKKDLDEYGVRMNLEDGDMTYNETLKSSQEFLRILKKHGWDENFWVKAQAIFMGVAILSSEEASQESNPQFEETKKQIESNSALSEEMKKQLLEQLAAAQAAMGAQKQSLRRSINPQDLLLVKPHVEALKEIME